jgi:RNA recognition motif-containing protein
VCSIDDLNVLKEADIRVDGKNLSIEEYRSEDDLKAKRNQEILKRVFLNNLPIDCTEEDVIDKL